MFSSLIYIGKTSRVGEFMCAQITPCNLSLTNSLRLFSELMHGKQINIKVELLRIRYNEKIYWFCVLHWSGGGRRRVVKLHASSLVCFVFLSSFTDADLGGKNKKLHGIFSTHRNSKSINVKKNISHFRYLMFAIGFNEKCNCRKHIFYRLISALNIYGRL